MWCSNGDASRSPGAARWDSFRLVTPNWLIALTDRGYDGDDPDGYLPRDEIVAFLE
jgi:putative flavoprotein involved in K+ transport